MTFQLSCLLTVTVHADYLRTRSERRLAVLSTDAARALAAALGAAGALRHDPGTASVVAEIGQARAALRELTATDDLMAHVLDRLLVEVIACRLASRRRSPRLDLALRHALVLADGQPRI
jgi:hypothetical protein